MFKLFRTIRKKALENQAFRQYLAYAIGEIVLVVLGILIALQINNWSEARKQSKVETEILKEIRLDLLEIQHEVEGDLGSHQKALNSGILLKNFLNNSAVYEDSITRHFFRCMNDRQTYPKTGGYESLKSQGLEIISDDSLRSSITDIYQLTFTRLVEFGQSNPKYDLRNRLYPYYQKYFKLSQDAYRQDSLPGVDQVLKLYRPEMTAYEAMRSDQTFLIDLQESFDIRRKKINRHLWALEDIEHLLQLIDASL